MIERGAGQFVQFGRNVREGTHGGLRFFQETLVAVDTGVEDGHVGVVDTYVVSAQFLAKQHVFVAVLRATFVKPQVAEGGAAHQQAVSGDGGKRACVAILRRALWFGRLLVSAAQFAAHGDFQRIDQAGANHVGPVALCPYFFEEIGGARQHVAV